MMKKLWIPVLIGLIGLGAHADPILFWGSDSAFSAVGSGVYYINGELVPQGTQWLVELVNNADGSVLYSTTDGFANGQGQFFSIPDATAWNGMVVKTVIYDAATRELAGLQAEFSGGAFSLSWSTLPSPPSTFSYDAGSVTSALGWGAGQWHAIPEPAVATLITVFGSGLLMVQRISKRSAVDDDV